MKEFLELSLPSRCLAKPEAGCLSISCKSRNAELAPGIHLGASRQAQVSALLHRNLGFRKPWKPGSNKNWKPISDPQKSIHSTEHLQLLQCIYACFLNKHFQICLYFFQIKLNKIILVRITKPSEAEFYPLWLALLGLMQSYTLHTSFDCIAKQEEQNENSRYFFLMHQKAQ